MKKRKAIIITCVILALVLIFGAMAASRRGTKSEVVKTAAVLKGELKSYLSTNAVIKSKETKSYIGVSQFTVKKVYVELGDKVKKGKTMLEYDLYDLYNSVKQARIQYNNAVLQRKELLNQQNQIEDTAVDLDKQIKKMESSTNPADLLQLQSLRQKRDSIQAISDEKLKLMDNSISLAKLGLDSAESKYDRYKGGMTAEFSGVVTALNAVEEGSLSPAQPAIVVQQLDNLKAVMSLGKYDALKVKNGQEATLKYGDNLYNGKISFINPAAAKSVSITGQETSLDAEIDILDEDPGLKVDFDVNVDILLGSVKDSVKLPIESLKYDKDGKAYVFKVAGGKAKQVSVKLGIQSDTEAQVLEGLVLGDAVILNPGISIKDGTAVKSDEGEKQ